MSMRFILAFSFFSGVLAGAPRLLAEDWPMWGRDQTRNMVSPEKHPPADWQIEVKDENTGAVTQAARNIKWSVPLGSQSKGTPVVANGLMFTSSRGREGASLRRVWMRPRERSCGKTSTRRGP